MCFSLTNFGILSTTLGTVKCRQLEELLLDLRTSELQAFADTNICGHPLHTECLGNE